MSAVTGGLASVRPRRTTGWPPGHRAATVVVITGAFALGAAHVVDAMQDAAGRAEHMQFAVAEGGVVRVSYDLAADDPQAIFAVRLYVSVDGGQTYRIVTTASGDLGPAVIPGPGKLIVWESARDVERLDADRLRFRISATATGAPGRPRSRWGVSASWVPEWRIPSGLEHALFSRASGYSFSGTELRFGFVRGRMESGHWGVSIVRRQVKAGSFVRSAGAFRDESSDTTLLTTRSLWLTGIDAHVFIPLMRVGRRHQLGLGLAGGANPRPIGTVQRRVEGAIYSTNPVGAIQPAKVVPEGPGFVFSDDFGVLSVGPGERAFVDRVPASELFRYSKWGSDLQVIARAEIAYAVALGNRLKVRFGGGINVPGVHVFSVEFVSFFGGN